MVVFSWSIHTSLRYDARSIERYLSTESTNLRQNLHFELSLFRLCQKLDRSSRKYYHRIQQNRPVQIRLETFLISIYSQSSQLKKLVPQFNPQLILLDYERAELTAYSQKFPSATICTCSWHFYQCLRRAAQKFNITSELVLPHGAFHCIYKILKATPYTQVWKEQIRHAVVDILNNKLLNFRGTSKDSFLLSFSLQKRCEIVETDKAPCTWTVYKIVLYENVAEPTRTVPSSSLGAAFARTSRKSIFQSDF